MSLPRYAEYRDSGVKWLGQIPSHWAVCALAYRYEVALGKMLDEKRISGQHLAPYLRNVDVQWGRINTEDLPQMDFAGGDTARYGLRPGDLLVCEGGEVGRAAIWEGQLDECYYQKALHRLRPRSVRDTGRFFLYVLRAGVAQGIFSGEGGKATIAHLPAETFRRIPFPFPPAVEQRAIAEFLDRQTAKIDALIAEQETLLALLAEKRRATISHAVTRGLDPNVPLKESGISWLGEVPRHWDVIALGRITASKCDGPFGSGLKSEHYVEDGARVIRLQNIRGGAFDGRDAAFIGQSYFDAEMKRHDVREGDVLIAGLGDDNNTVGRACVAPPEIYPALVKADCFRFRLDTGIAIPQFVAWALTVGSRYDAGTLSSGSTRSRIPLSVMAGRRIPLPPISEQRQISGHIDALQSRFDALSIEAERAIAMLRERRSALITAAVTGQIDVRAATPAHTTQQQEHAPCPSFA